MQKTSEEDKTFESYLLEGVTNILDLINKESLETKESYVEPLLPTPASLLAQFASRPIFTVSEIVDDQLMSSYWLTAAADELNGDAENVGLP